MSWSFLDRVVAIWVAIIATIAVVFVFVGLGNLVFDNSANISSWVQSIGSICAILVAVWISNSSSREEKRNSIVKARAFASMLNSAYLGMKISVRDNYPFGVMLTKGTMQEALLVGREIKIELLPAECIGSIISLRSIASSVVLTADLYLNNINSETARSLVNVLDVHFLKLSEHIVLLSSAHPGIAEAV